MLKGRIKKLDTDNGFGFINPSIKGDDVHFRLRPEIVDDSRHKIEAGAQVEYEVGTNHATGKITARRVVITGPASNEESSYKNIPRTGLDLKVPSECIFDTFYVDGHKRREIYIEAAEKLSVIFSEANLTRSSVRRLFQMLKAMEREMKTNKALPLAKVKECFYEFHRLVTYNNTRRGEKGPIVPDVFKTWVEAHLEVATKNGDEFNGFVEYLTSIVARIKEK